MGLCLSKGKKDEKKKDGKSEVPPPAPVASLDGVPNHELLNIEILKSRPLAPRNKTTMKPRGKPKKPVAVVTMTSHNDQELKDPPEFGNTTVFLKPKR